jgi:asparagine N-glycosylation enzyme membrane subunit Stt3
MPARKYPVNPRSFVILDRAAIAVLWFISVSFVAVLITFSQPAYWEYVIAELGPMTWFESLLLFFAAVLAFLCAGLDFVRRRGKDAFMWAVLAVGFLGLCADERFAIHERIRDNILAPHNVKLIFFWVSPGDITLLLVMVAGLIFLFFILKQFKERKPAMLVFLAAVAVSAAAVISDSLDFTRMTIDELRYEQFIEELIETSAMLLYVTSLYLMLSHKIKALH